MSHIQNPYAQLCGQQAVSRGLLAGQTLTPAELERALGVWEGPVSVCPPEVRVFLTHQYSFAFLPRKSLLIPGLGLLPLQVPMPHPACAGHPSLAYCFWEAFILKLLQGSENV